ncbi:conserved Plasmodium protein, unknown function [Plasmodium sp. gorilla clade G3]|nr:conserved Plasmodium protein, unknown function [Plasmodium sp. gorilla clade G3]
MAESSYRDTQLFKPNGVNIFDSNLGMNNKISENISAEELFQSKNIYRDVKSKVIPGPIKTTTVEKVTKIPKIIFRERQKDIVKKEKKIIHKEVEIEKIVEVIENKDEIVYNEVKVPKYIDVPILQPRQEVHYQQISKNVPRGVELVITQTLEVPRIKPKYVEIPVPIYVPCYIEVPIPAQYIPIEQNDDKDHFTSGISNASKLSKHPHMQNNTMEFPHHYNNPYVMNPNLNMNDDKSVCASSKASIQNISSEQKNVEKMVIAGNL